MGAWTLKLASYPGVRAKLDKRDFHMQNEGGRDNKQDFTGITDERRA
jgi:hypothetical protein